MHGLSSLSPEATLVTGIFKRGCAAMTNTAQSNTKRPWHRREIFLLLQWKVNTDTVAAREMQRVASFPADEHSGYICVFGRVAEESR